MGYKILVVDDDMSIHKWINEYNKSHNLNYIIEAVTSKTDLVGYLLSHPVDLVLMAWNLQGGKSGIDLVKDLRLNSTTNHIPIIFCTIKEAISDQVEALNQGADDFFRKSNPLSLLFSKINAVLRCEDRDRNESIQMMRKFSFDDNSLEVDHQGETHKLTNKEYTILKTLVENPKKVFSQEDLNKLTSGDAIHVSRRCIDTFINLLRKKLGRNSIISIRKRGYKLNDTEILLQDEE